MMASIVAWLIGLLFLGIGIWILLLRFEGLIDRIWPHSMQIGRLTIDGEESKSHAELLRARFDHHFRRPVAIAKDTGFLEVLTLDTPDLFQKADMETPLSDMTIEVSGVDVGFLIRTVNQLAQPDRWIIEGDFQIKSDRALLALRMRRGARLIRTWYLERTGDTAADKSMLLEQLIDDAIFQLAYDFGNKAEQDEDLKKWRHVLPQSVDFPSRSAVAAFFEGRGALGRYYAYGEWSELDLAVDRLRTLRSQMPEYANGLKLLGMALAEKRREAEAIHVFEQLELLLLPSGEKVDQLDIEGKRRYLPINLLKATARIKLYTWQASHEAIGELLYLHQILTKEIDAIPSQSIAACSSDGEPLEQQGLEQETLVHTQNFTALNELRAQAATQLAYAYALYLSYLRDHTVLEMFTSDRAPRELLITNTEHIKALQPSGSPQDAKPLVRKIMGKIEDQHENWLQLAEADHGTLEQHWCALADGERRQSELLARLNLVRGYGHYRIAELEDDEAQGEALVLGVTYAERLEKASTALRKAEAAHPNHYLALQRLGLVYAEPRRDARNLSIAEQYVERAILANRDAYYSHALLARILLQRVANSGLDIESRSLLDRGLSEAQVAVNLREFSGTSQLLRAQFQLLLLEIERDEERRRELRSGLEQSVKLANRFLPYAFGRPNVDLTWVSIVSATRQLGENAEALQESQTGSVDLARERQDRFEQSRKDLIEDIDALLADCATLQARWVAQQRVFQVNKLEQNALQLKEDVEKAKLENWRDIKLQIL